MAQRHQKELGGTRQMSLGTKIVIAIFAIMMAFSMMLPSLTAIFANGGSSSSPGDEAAQTDETTGDESTDDTADEGDGEQASDEADEEADDATADVPDNDSLKSLAEQYADEVASYDERLKDDPTNLAALLNAGQAYMNWGYSAAYSSSTDEETSYSNGLLDKAVEYFDRYLDVRDSVAVKVDKALCSYYAGKTDEAIEALEALATGDDTNPLVWANLGMLYESQYNTEKATEAYQNATAADPDDEYGAYTYANQRLISLNSGGTSLGDAGEASADDVSTATNTGLTSTLTNDSGVGF